MWVGFEEFGKGAHTTHTLEPPLLALDRPPNIIIRVVYQLFMV